MRVFIAILAFVLLLPVVSIATDCGSLWETVSGKTYVLTAGEQQFDVVFSLAEVGPCPQGTVEIYDGIYIAPRATCRYVSKAKDIIEVTCDKVKLYFLSINNSLLLIDPEALTLTLKSNE